MDLSKGTDVIWSGGVRRWCGAHRAEFLCAALMALLAGNLLSVLPRKTITVDERVHIPAGFAYLHGDFRPNSEHPPLTKLLAALPLLPMGLRGPAAVPPGTPMEQTSVVTKYFWQDNRSQFAAIGYWARVPMIALTVALGMLLFGFARSLFGPRAAVLALTLFSLDPTVLAHGRVVHTDIAAALGFCGTVVALYWYLRRPSFQRAILLGLVVGAALVTKFSLLIFSPVLGGILIILFLTAPRLGLRRWQVAVQAMIGGVVALVAINAAYAFQRQPVDAGDRDWIRREAGERAGVMLAGIDMLGLLVPPRFLFGICQQVLHNEAGHPAALLGEYATGGWWYYFPVAYALKTPPPLLLLVVAACSWALWRALAGRERRLFWILAPLALYALAAISTTINIGVRHLLPLYPFLFILGGLALDRLICGRFWRGVRQALVIALVGWLAVEATLAYPHYMTYISPIARSEPSWYYLSDSNVEWGDDIGALARYLHERDETAVTGALLNGGALEDFGIASADQFSSPPPGDSPRYVAIGASYLNGSTVPLDGGHMRPDYFARYRALAPEAVFGGSIYLYRNEPPLPGPDGPLPGAAFRATIAPRLPPTTLHPGQTLLLGVTVRNDGEVAWPGTSGVNYQIRLGNRWFEREGGALVLDDARAPLPHAVAPGESIRLHLLITAPAQPGEYWLAIELVQEGVTWFGDRGSTPARFAVRVEP